jgi:hypothetical protein
MCTVSWLSRSQGGYDVFFNRDEQPTRPARGPERCVAGGVPYLAPRDVEAGGTWISVNAFGVTVSMTNQYPQPAAAQPANPISRGLLLASLVDAMSLAEVEHRVRHLGLERYRPFAIAAFEPVGPPKSLRWNGSALTTELHSNPGFVLTSSGATPPELEETRRTIFTEAIDLNGLTATTLTQVHRDHRPERGPLSVCMHRPEAATVSYCHITVAGASGDILFRYAPGPPCTTSVQHPLTLPRVDRLAPT